MSRPQPSPLDQADRKAAEALRREFASPDVFTDHMAAARLLMSPPLVRDLMLRLIAAHEVVGCITVCGAGFHRCQYRFVPRADDTPTDRFAPVNEGYRAHAIARRMAAVHQQLMRMARGEQPGHPNSATDRADGGG